MYIIIFKICAYVKYVYYQQKHWDSTNLRGVKLTTWMMDWQYTLIVNMAKILINPKYR